MDLFGPHLDQLHFNICTRSTLSRLEHYRFFSAFYSQPFVELTLGEEVRTLLETAPRDFHCSRNHRKRLSLPRVSVLEPQGVSLHGTSLTMQVDLLQYYGKR